MILECDCQHTYQDKTYGRGQRVHNQSGLPNKEFKYKCTVCSKIKDFTPSKKKDSSESKGQKKKKK